MKPDNESRIFWSFLFACVLLIVAAGVVVSTAPWKTNPTALILILFALAGILIYIFFRVVKGSAEIKLPSPAVSETDMNPVESELTSKASNSSPQIDRSLLDSVISNMREGVLVLNARGEILFANRSFKSLFGADREVLNKSYLEFSRDPVIRQLVQKALTQRQGGAAEVNLTHPQERILQTEAMVFESGKGREAVAILVFHDITNLKRLEEIRRDFVANVSHELRTPLTSIKGYVEALQDGAINEKNQAKEFLSIIWRHSERMNKLITDLLLLSQLEAEGFPLRKEKFDIKSLIAEVVDQFQQMARKKSVKLDYSVEGEIDSLYADRDRINQVLSNLIDNAIKYTPNGGKVQVKARRQKLAVEISVRDTGSGIPSTDLPRIFERFYTVDKARSREMRGTGLGLSIVKHIVEAHQGRVWAESELGQGSTFYFYLPDK
ncbi:MAG: phosphate regulon sensor histidine kinase PhoR [candidate division Zixibacteria bacterium]|nr:phosphate regulon sensor histidine kinase PhoR [candidate division Zixibacteria bacterium]